MDALARFEAAKLHPVDAATAVRAEAQKVAHQFEDVLVRSLVAAMRQSASVDGESGGMFGGEPGADTYADWFDEHVASELGRSGRIGVADVLMKEFERWQQIPAAAEPADHPGAARSAAQSAMSHAAAGPFAAGPFAASSETSGRTPAERRAELADGLKEARRAPLLRVDAALLRHQQLHAIAGGGLDVAL